MEHLIRSAGSASPAIDFDPQNGLLRMRGESYPENTFEFFKPIIAWLREFLATDAPTVTMELDVSYLNTGSIKCLMDMFELLDGHHQSGRNARIVWRYHANNPRALETAEEFAEDLTLPFDIEKYVQ